MTVDPDEHKARVKALAADMRRVDPEKDYYQVTLTASENGTLVWGAYSHFEGFTDDTCTHEFRAASLVRADRLLTLFQEMGESCVVVNHDRALQAFLLLGGHALVESKIAEEHLSDVLSPSASARSGPLGFKALSSVPPTALQHAPTKKQRFRILKRDEYRCRVCGQRPSDDVNVTLHVHHVRIWSRGGLTEDSNLITLCETCHGGLDPHEDFGLFGLFPGGSVSDRLAHSRSDFAEGVRRYREMVRRILKRETDDRDADD